VELTSADLMQVASGLGAHGVRVSTNGDFADAPVTSVPGW